MTNMLFYVLMLGLSVSFMNGSMRYSGINRVFMLLQRGIMEYSVVTCDEEHNPYYNQALLKRSVDDYFRNNLSKYVRHYTTGIYYINPDNSICLGGYCQSVQISLKANVNYLFSFDKAMVFTISSLEDKA